MAELSSDLTRMQPGRPFILIFFFALGQMAAESEPSLSSDAMALLEFSKAVEGLELKSWDRASVDSSGCPLDWKGIQCSGGLVTSINLENLNLRGEIKLGHLQSMKMLSNLSLSNNFLSGKLPSELHSLSSLQHLDISKNLFYGRIPSGIVTLERLVYLNLSLNNLTEKIPQGLEKLRELRTLDLHSNLLSGPLDGGLMEMQSIEYVDFSSNGLSGALPQMLLLGSGVQKSLQHLNLSNNEVEGTLLFLYYGPLESLRVLDMSNNRLSGQLPSFQYFYSLETLRLSNNRFSGNFPNALLAEDTLVLKELDLSRNMLSGKHNWCYGYDLLEEFSGSF